MNPLDRPSSDSRFTFLLPPQKPDEIGRLAHYRVLKVLGEGGMGVVFLAEDTLLSRTVALKTMKPEVAADPRHRQRFIREGKAAAKVEHDNIVPIYHVGEERGVPWLAMPLLKGQSLDEMLKRMKVLKPDQAIRLGAQMAKGLAAAHAAGLIHRDIKPANIWIEPEGGGRARLLDFGLARDQSPERERGDEPLTRTGAVMGTPAYMATEQARGEALDARADLFSLGCVLYRAVTGRLPFRGQGAMGTLLSLATETPPAPHEVNPDVPQALSALIMNLLAKDRSARPPSAPVVAAVLQALQETSTTTAPVAKPVAVPVAPKKEANPWADLTEVTEQPAPAKPPRRRWRVATAAALLLVLAGGLVAGIVVIIKNNKGEEVGRVTVPEGGSAVIQQDGDSKRKGDPTDTDPDRRAAKWVLSIGGTVMISQDGHERDIGVATDLPVTPFELVAVGLDSNPKVDDDGLVHLKGLTNLKRLRLTGTRVSDIGVLEHLKKLTSLTDLELYTTHVSDAALVHLKGLTNLKSLGIGYTRSVTDAGLVQLKGLTKLTGLGLGGTKISSSSLAHLKGLNHLVYLHLGDTSVGSAGLENLKTLTELMMLDLRNTQVMDDGLRFLEGLTKLTDLNLTGTHVKAEGVDRLQKALPKCRIVFDPAKK